MATLEITRDQLFDALYDALGLVHEWDSIADKLGVFGLDTDDVHDLLDRRWAQYLNSGADPKQANGFVRGFVEGILTGLQLGRRHE